MDKWSDWDNWIKAGEWPFVPPGYVLLPPAMEQISRAIFQDDWIGNEFGFEPHYMSNGVPPPHTMFVGDDDDDALPADIVARQYYGSVWFWHSVHGPLAAVTPPPLGKWREAYERFSYCFQHGDSILDRKYRACRKVQTLAAAGALELLARNEATGEMVPIPAARWNCDTNIADARFARGRVNLLKLMYPVPHDWKERRNYLARMTSWLFVTQANLAAVLASLQPKAAEEVAKSTAKAEDGAKKWLTKEFDDPKTAKMAKADFKTAAKGKFAGLSDRAFERAWTLAAKGRPERTRKGSRGNRRTESIR